MHKLSPTITLTAPDAVTSPSSTAITSTTTTRGIGTTNTRDTTTSAPHVSAPIAVTAALPAPAPTAAAPRATMPRAPAATAATPARTAPAPSAPARPASTPPDTRSAGARRAHHSYGFCGSAIDVTSVASIAGTPSSAPSTQRPVTSTQESGEGARTPRTCARHDRASAAQHARPNLVIHQPPSGFGVTKPVRRISRPRKVSPLPHSACVM